MKDKCWYLLSTCRYSLAVIDRILDDRECMVTFENGISVATKISSLRRPDDAEEIPGEVVHKRKKRENVEKKRKKTNGRTERLKEVDDMCRREQSNWKDFNSKFLAKVQKGKLVKAMNHTSDTVTGRVAFRGATRTPYSSNPHRGF